MSSKKEIKVNCGISHVSVSTFVSDGKSIILEQIALKTLHYDYSNDQNWLAALISGLDELCQKQKLKGNARFIFPGSLLLNKTIRVPHVDEEKQKNQMSTAPRTGSAHKMKSNFLSSFTGSSSPCTCIKCLISK